MCVSAPTPGPAADPMRSFPIPKYFQKTVLRLQNLCTLRCCPGLNCLCSPLHSLLYLVLAMFIYGLRFNCPCMIVYNKYHGCPCYTLAAKCMVKKPTAR